MPLYFITGNADKFAEAKAVLPEIEQLKIDLPEIQELNPKLIVEEKLKEARKHHEGEFIIEDQSFAIAGLNGLPGPFIRWFLEALQPLGIANLALKSENPKATASTIIGYVSRNGTIHFFESSTEGEVVLPRGKGGYGWDPIFCRQVRLKQMESEKNQIPDPKV